MHEKTPVNKPTAKKYGGWLFLLLVCVIYLSIFVLNPEYGKSSFKVTTHPPAHKKITKRA